jgi:hypothetical protein
MVGNPEVGKAALFTSAAPTIKIIRYLSVLLKTNKTANLDRFLRFETKRLLATINTKKHLPICGLYPDKERARRKRARNWISLVCSIQDEVQAFKLNPNNKLPKSIRSDEFDNLFWFRGGRMFFRVDSI